MTYFSFTGSFILNSESVIINDPVVASGITAAQNKAIYNCNSLQVSKLLPGAYNSYHLIDEDATILKQIIIHNSYNINELADASDYKLVGQFGPSFSHAMVIVDEMDLLNSENCYFDIEPCAFYSAHRIIKEIPNMPYADDVKDNLRILAEQNINNSSEVLGSTIMDIVDGYPLWEGFKHFKKDSGQWTTELLNRLECSYLEVETIKGGIATKVDAIQPLNVYEYYDNSNSAYAIVVDLCNPQE